MEKTAKLMVKFGKTVNLGNYESQRLDVSLEITTEEIGYKIKAIELYHELEVLITNLLDEP